MADHLTIPQTAAQLNAPEWLVRRLADRLCKPARVGLYRVLTPEQVEVIRQELIRREERSHVT